MNKILLLALLTIAVKSQEEELTPIEQVQLAQTNCYNKYKDRIDDDETNVMADNDTIKACKTTNESCQDYQFYIDQYQDDPTKDYPSEDYGKCYTACADDLDLKSPVTQDLVKCRCIAADADCFVSQITLSFVVLVLAFLTFL